MTLALSVALAAVLTAPDAGTAVGDDAVERETAVWQQQRIQDLREEGWLSLVGLHWLSEGTHSAGSGADTELRFPSSVPAKLGVFEQHGATVRFVPDPSAKVTLGGKPFTGGALKTDESGAPDVLSLGPVSFHVIERQGRLGVRVKDAEAPALKAFHGIPRYPGRAAWRVEATLVPSKEKVTIPVPTVLGTVEPMPSPGKLVFSLQGKSYELTPVLEDESSLFVIFGDATNKTDTYGSGRFLSAPLPKDGKVILDFNRAYNPPCAFSKFATCPLPPKGNKLPLRIEAGEKRYGSH